MRLESVQGPHFPATCEVCRRTFDTATARMFIDLDAPAGQWYVCEACELDYRHDPRNAPDIDEETGAELETEHRHFPLFVNAYEQTQAYGGAAEGGWYYNAGTPLSSIECNNAGELEQARAYLESHYDTEDRDQWDTQRRRGSTSAAGGYDIVIRVEQHYGEPYPQERPQYE